MSDAILIAIIGVVESVLIWYLNKKSNQKADANHQESMQSISRGNIDNMIMWDQFNYKTNGKLPTNYEEIHDTYDIYHANHGNGTCTKRVQAYDEWYESVEKELNKKRSK